jgi:aspartyl-tRNA(Asn)/glutamyl-tRNA(Gln) amidotransferase subunit C
MRISEAEIRNVAALARLELSDTEVHNLVGDMNEILGYVAKLEELDTTGVEPTSHVVGIASAYRDDEVTSEPAPDDAVANAPQAEDNQFVVPSIIE